MFMNISSTSLFHFTSNIDTLKNILENDFFAQYSVENFLNVITGDTNPNLEKGIPMVCFCDIPLSQIAKHTKIYGSYALGLTKEWAFKNKINPIIYTYHKSDLADNIIELTMKLIKDKDEKDNLYYYMSQLIQYIKPYKGTFKKGTKTFKNLRFYNEREWRFIPQLFNERIPVWLKKSEGRDLNPREINKDIIENKYSRAKLKFEAQDIKHIIVKTEKEIPKVIKIINSIKTSRYSIKEAQFRNNIFFKQRDS